MSLVKANKHARPCLLLLMFYQTFGSHPGSTNMPVMTIMERLTTPNRTTEVSTLIATTNPSSTFLPTAGTNFTDNKHTLHPNRMSSTRSLTALRVCAGKTSLHQTEPAWEETVQEMETANHPKTLCCL